jgi:hypothetical protein
MRAMYRGLALVILPLLAFVNVSVAASQSATELGPIGPIPITVGDVVYVFFSPPLAKVLAICESPDGGTYRQSTAMNESITNVPVQLGGDQGSYVQLTPQASGHYNLTLNIWSQMPFNMLLGILTQNANNFGPYAVHTVQNAYFVEIFTMRGINTANWSISFSFDVSPSPQQSFFLSIPLPSSANAVFLVLAIVGLTYPNAYLLTDYYYKSKKEEVSRKRKVGIAISVILSLIVIYWIYLRVI